MLRRGARPGSTSHGCAKRTRARAWKPHRDRAVQQGQRLKGRCWRLASLFRACASRFSARASQSFRGGAASALISDPPLACSGSSTATVPAAWCRSTLPPLHAIWDNGGPASPMPSCRRCRFSGCPAVAHFSCRTRPARLVISSPLPMPGPLPPLS